MTTDDFIFNTGHYRRLYTRFTQLCKVPQNTLKIHGRVLWHIPVMTDDFIFNTGHYRRLYTRFTQLCEVPQNKLKIHGHVLCHIPVRTDDFINVGRVGILIRRPRPCFAHRSDYRSVFTYGLGLTYYTSSVNVRTIYGCITLSYIARYDILVLNWLCEYTESYMNHTL